MPSPKTILVCPLDWGLGHATRMVPVIEALLDQGARVILGADNRPLSFLMQRFPGCEFVKLPGFTPVYPKDGSMALAMLKSFPQMRTAANKAHELLQKIISEKQVDIVISDNRYELHSENAYCIFITHQLDIATPGITAPARPIIRGIINQYIRKYNELWIPDFEGEPNLSGKLSHIKNMPVNNYHFIGPLSRFIGIKAETPAEEPDILVLLSGPEPQRTILEELLISQLTDTGKKAMILQGKPEETPERHTGNIKLIPHLPDEKMAGLIKSAKLIISRPGYSTIMDLAVLGKKAVFIPTPGQTEQEYLAERFKREKNFYSEPQKTFELKRAMEKQGHYKGLSVRINYRTLEKRIDTILKQIQV
ncbi:MAG: glycosyltransferase [Chlorobi bacterium]|nr:glycosyltransferase [Chlorobiota bacterium]